MVSNTSSSKPEKINIKLIGLKKQVDATTLINTLTHVQNLIKEIGRIFSKNTQEIDIKINFLETEFYIIQVTLENINEQPDLFTADNDELLNDLSTLTSLLIAIYTYKKGHKIVLENKEDLKLVVDFIKQSLIKNITTNFLINLYNNIIIRESISKIMDSVSVEDSIQAIEFITSSAQLMIPKEELAELIYDEFDKEVESVTELRYYVDEKAILSIVTLSFDRRKKWQFYYKGHKISVAVKNEAFRHLLDNGLSISKGDKLEVVLRIQQMYNGLINDFVNKKYEIEEFLDYVKQPKQTNFLIPQEVE